MQEAATKRLKCLSGGTASPSLPETTESALQHPTGGRQPGTIWSEEGPNPEGPGFPLRAG
jgi:hypothetical protein